MTTKCFIITYQVYFSLGLRMQRLSRISERELYRRIAGYVVDDMAEAITRLAGYPLMVIESLTAPVEARPGVELDIVMVDRNDGLAGYMYYEVFDADTAVSLYRSADIWVGDYNPPVVDPIPGIIMPNRDLRIRVEIGHAEL